MAFEAEADLKAVCARGRCLHVGHRRPCSPDVTKHRNVPLQPFLRRRVLVQRTFQARSYAPSPRTPGISKVKGKVKRELHPSIICFPYGINYFRNQARRLRHRGTDCILPVTRAKRSNTLCRFC